MAEGYLTFCGYVGRRDSLFRGHGTPVGYLGVSNADRRAECHSSNDIVETYEAWASLTTANPDPGIKRILNVARKAIKFWFGAKAMSEEMSIFTQFNSVSFKRGGKQMHCTVSV